MTTLAVITVVARSVHLAGLISAFGTLTFAVVIDPGGSLRLRQMFHRLTRLSAGSALLFGLVWFTLETAIIAGADSPSAILRAVPIVGFNTQYGRWFMLRCLTLLGVLLLPLSHRFASVAALVLAGLALAVQPLLGHAGAIGGSAGAALITSEVLHLLAAGAWLGGLLPLFLAIGILPQNAAAQACRNFTPLGLAAVLLLAGTAAAQVVTLMGGLAGLFGTRYGQVALIKLGLFAALLLLAALNRLVLTERMAEGGAPSSFRRSIAAEMLLGALVIGVAGWLASLTPGTHEQPVWPFPWRLSFAAISEPTLRAELLGALAGVCIAIAIGITGLVWRRVRWFALAAALLIPLLAIPHLDLLFVVAYPTSFFASPTEFAATAIAHGARLFAANCTPCHGSSGHGDGPLAKSLPLPPADLTAAHFWGHSEGDLYWFISHGFTTADGDVAMPGFGGALSSAAIWHLIDFLRANNAGESLRRTGQWSHALPVPQFDATCPDGRGVDLDDLRGRLLHIVLASGDEQAEPPWPADPGVTNIVVLRRPVRRPTVPACVTREPETWTAFAILLGLSPESASLAGVQIIADQNGWLRMAWRPGQPGDWTEPSQLAAALRAITTHPLTTTGPGTHVHAH